MPNFTVKFTTFNFDWGSAPNPAGGTYSTPIDPLAGFREKKKVKKSEWSGVEG